MQIREVRMTVEIPPGNFVNDPDARAMATREAENLHPTWKDWIVDDVHYVNGAAFVTVMSRTPK